MKDSHLTIRLPRALVSALDAESERRGLARSHLVREAVAEYVAVPRASRAPRTVTAAQLAAAWHTLPALSPSDAESFAADVECARDNAPPPVPEWD